MPATNQNDIKLRAIEPEDLDFLYGIENESELWSVGTTNVPYSRYNLYEYVANAKSDIYIDRQVRLIVENEEKEVVGIVDLMNFDPRHMRAEIGIVIQNRQRRKGYAQAAIEKIKLYAAETLRLHQIYAVVSADNTASLNLFEKCGFSVTAELKDWLGDGKNYQKACLLQFFV